MERQKIIKLLDNENTQPCNCRTKRYDIKDIQLKTTMLKSRLCDGSDAYILMKETNSCWRRGKHSRNDKQVIFKNCAPFTNCITK